MSYRRYQREDHKPSTFKPIPKTSGLFLQLILYPKKGPTRDFALLLKVGSLKEEKGFSIARIDSWHARLHIDMEYGEGSKEKFWLEKEDSGSEKRFALAPVAESYFRRHWRAILEQFIAPQPDFTAPPLYHADP